MTTLDQRRETAGPTRERPDPDALIKDACRRQRRRYLVTGAALCITAAVVGVVLATSSGGGGRAARSTERHTAPKARPTAPPTSTQRSPGVALPSSVLFNQISVTTQGLLLTGITRASAADLTPTCARAAVDPESLSVGTVVTGNCDDPRLFGLTVQVVNTPIPRSNNATVSINSASPTGHVRVGPVVMTYGSYSDTHPVVAYGSHWVWVYDVETTFGPELLQISTRSGSVVNALPMPQLFRPLLAPDDGGVWVANSIEGSAAPALFYVEAGSSVPIIVVHDPRLPICWLTAAGSTAWVGAGTYGGCATFAVEKFADGASAPVFTTPGTGYPTFSVVGSEAEGLWTMQWSWSVLPGVAGPERIIYIDPDTGIQSVVATTPPVLYPLYSPSDGLSQGQGVYFDGGLYLLEPPFHRGGYLGYSSIVRVDAARPADSSSP
jgi:hypothetical protein